MVRRRIIADGPAYLIHDDHATASRCFLLDRLSDDNLIEGGAPNSLIALKGYS